MSMELNKCDVSKVMILLVNLSVINLLDLQEFNFKDN